MYVIVIGSALIHTICYFFFTDCLKETELIVEKAINSQIRSMIHPGFLEPISWITLSGDF